MPILPNGLDTKASFAYLKDDELYETEKPFYLDQVPNAPEGHITNLLYDVRQNVAVHDLRGNELSLSLESDLFCLLRAPVTGQYDLSRSEDMKKYSSETNELLKAHSSFDKVICYDLRVSTPSPQL
ncbi:hypothetical protein TWF718_003757 [Orbilia javanica]|uniref:Uncharacterized protein n=1 Tax=Orbilia javanica TaxID=47235 RepID=A0AAN8MWN2_9PEZI